MLRYLVIVALVAACGSAPRPAATPAGPLALVGWWREVATGQIVVIDPSRLEVRDPDAAIPGPAAPGSAAPAGAAATPGTAAPPGTAATPGTAAVTGTADPAAATGTADPAAATGTAGPATPATAGTATPATAAAPGAAAATGPAGPAAATGTAGTATPATAAAPGAAAASGAAPGPAGTPGTVAGAGGDGGRVAEGSWVGDSAGRFLARAYGLPSGADAPGWLGAAAGFALDGADRVLLDRAGHPVARLVPAAPGVSSGVADPGRPPSEAEQRASRPAAPLPAGLQPVGDLTGRWVPVEQPGPGGAFVQFAADGTWTGSDSCTDTGGAWLAGNGGAFLATASSVMTFVACPGVGVAPQVGAARRIGLDGSTLVLLDADGAPVGRYHRA